VEEWVHSRNDELENRVERVEFSRERILDPVFELATLHLFETTQSVVLSY